jgi:hypothetical protein
VGIGQIFLRWDDRESMDARIEDCEGFGRNSRNGYELVSSNAIVKQSRLGVRDETTSVHDSPAVGL